jgi:hypothetical protein
MSDINLALTAAGEALMAKIKLGNGTLPLTITRIVTSSQPSPDPLNSTALVAEEQQFRIIGKTALGARTTIRTYLNNFGDPSTTPPTPPLAVGYTMAQIGIFAIDPDDGEILMRISQFDSPNYVPAANERAWEFEPSFNFVTGNASVVNITIDASGTATVGQVNDHVEKTIASAEGVHGLRFYNDELQYWDGSAWQEIKTTPKPPASAFSIVGGVLSNAAPFGTITPNADANTLNISEGFATVSGQNVNLINN